MRIVVLSAALLLASVPAAALPPATVAAPYVVVGDVTLTGELTFAGPIVVAPGSRLTFQDAVVHLDWPALCSPGRTSLLDCARTVTVDHATLRVLDSVVDSRAYDAEVPWSGWTVLGVASVLEFERSDLSGFRSIVLQSPGAERSRFIDNRFHDGVQGPTLLRGAEGDVVGNVMEDVLAGVHVTDGTTTIVGNTLRRVSGTAISAQSTIVGERLYDGTMLVEGNLVEGAAQGILALSDFAFPVRGNVIRDARIGINVGVQMDDTTMNGVSPVVERNVVERAETALHVYPAGAATTPRAQTVHAHHNSFLDTRCADVFVDIAPEQDATVDIVVDARENWWGSPDGPQTHGRCLPIEGETVLVDPWLTSPP